MTNQNYKVHLVHFGTTTFYFVRKIHLKNSIDIFNAKYEKSILFVECQNFRKK